MIPLAYTDRQVVARLDAQGSDHYDIIADRIPAYNGAQDIISSSVQQLLDAKKFSGEAFRDLNFTAVFQTSQFGLIAVDRLLSTVTIPSINGQPPAAQQLWTVVAVHPEFRSTGAQTINPDPVAARSTLRQDVIFTTPVKSAKRYTAEQRAMVRQDVFAPGNMVFTGDLKEYGYTFGSRSISDRAVTDRSMEVFPITEGTRQLVAVNYLKRAALIPDMEETDPLYNTFQLEWPASISELLITVTLRILSYKQGDRTTLNSLTTQEMGYLLQALA